MNKNDSTNALDENPFAYHQYKNGNVSISWNEKEVTIIKGKKAEIFVRQIENTTEFDAQMIMAKTTGNFKRGNEREGKLIGQKHDR